MEQFTNKMNIGNAVERGSWIYIYDEKGHQLAIVPGGTCPGDGLRGYTGSTVSVKRGSFIRIYDQKGRQIGTNPAGSK
jgi:hypothetical protein